MAWRSSLRSRPKVTETTEPSASERARRVFQINKPHGYPWLPHQ
jgi:hypothetical protein